MKRITVYGTGLIAGSICEALGPFVQCKVVYSCEGRAGERDVVLLEMRDGDLSWVRNILDHDERVDEYKVATSWDKEDRA